MRLNTELRKMLIFLISFLGLFLISRFAIISPGIDSIPINKSEKPLSLNYGQLGIVNGENFDELFWSSASNENFQDIYNRLLYLMRKKARIKDVTIYLHPELFAQKVFDGNDLNRLIPYYSTKSLLDRVIRSGISYELVINFLKYKVGVPFRSSREIGLIVNNQFWGKGTIPYFSRRIKVQSKGLNYIENTHFFWQTIDMITRANIALKIAHRKSKPFPKELKIDELIGKVQKIYKNRVKIINN